jgi:hypothetical protein
MPFASAPKSFAAAPSAPRPFAAAPPHPAPARHPAADALAPANPPTPSPTARVFAPLSGWALEAWLNDALQAAVEHAYRQWPVQFLLTDITEWRPGATEALLAGAPLRMSAMGREFTELRLAGRGFGSGAGRAGSLTPAQNHRANGR